MKGYATIGALAAALPAAWSRESASTWQPDNPAKGQCSVTSLVVQDLFGGELLATRTPGGLHFYNRIGGEVHDLTLSQFAEAIAFDDRPASREEAFRDTTPAQYQALRRRLGLQP